MPAIFSKNCILKGALDAYCLVCATHLPDEEDALAHIKDSKHNALMKPIAYYDKFKDDLIRKVNGVYFCEVCNMTFSTAAKVGIHVTEETHAEGRRRQLKRVGTSIVLQKDILIEERAWHGLIEDTCVLCNTEFEDVSNHKTEQSHVLNVIRSSVIIDNNNNIYRQVDGGCQCLTCNEIVSHKLITAHLNSKEHEGAVTKYEYNQDGGCSNDFTTENESKDIKKGDENAATKKLPSNECPDPHGKATNSGSPIMKANKSPVSSNSISKEVETFAKQHGLFVDKFNFTVNCKLCSSQIPATLNCVKEHVSGKKHKHNSMKRSDNIKNAANKFEKTNMQDFCDTIVQFTTVNDNQYVVFNDKYCLKSGDFLGLAVSNGKLVCLFCHIDLHPIQHIQHVKSATHHNMLENCFVITSLKTEFVRQIKSDLYHCGYCGTVESDFDDMLEHLTTVPHKLRKTDNEKMLQRFKMEEAIRFHRVLEFFPFLNLL